MRNIENGIGSGSASLAAPAPAPAEVRELTDTLLFILPFPEYPEIMARIRAAHPKLKIIYHYLKNTTERDCFFQHVEVPAGKHTKPCFPPLCSGINLAHHCRIALSPKTSTQQFF